MTNWRHGRENNYRHGGTHTKHWELWCRIRQVAKRLNVSVDLRWLGRGGFEAFVADVPERPSKQHEFIRIDIDLGYSPDNCRWATRIEARQLRPQRFKTSRQHGLTGTPTWQSWSNMRSRCEKPLSSGFARYGARGIRVCERWTGERGFLNFLDDMGERPSGMTLDRINFNGNYEPGNCRWATPAMQSRNTSAVKFEPHEPAQVRWLLSEGYSQAEVARFFGVDRGVIGHIARNRTWREDNQ